MSLGRPDRGSVENADRLFQILTGLYDAINGNRTSISQLEQRIITVADNSVTVNTTTGDTRPASPLEVGAGDFDLDAIPGPAPGGGGAGSSLARVWVSSPNPEFPYGVNMGALGAGTLQQTVTAGVATPTAFAGTTGSIPFYVAGSQLAQNNANLFWDNGNVRLGIGTAAPGFALDVLTNANGARGFRVTNSNAGSSAQVQNQLANDIGSLAYYGIASSTFSGFAPLDAGKGFVGSNATHFSIFTQSAHDIILSTTAVERIRIAAAGNVSIANLVAGGVVYATAATGVLKIGTSAEVASAITWPAAGQVLYSSGTATAPIGKAGFEYYLPDDVLWLGVGIAESWYNLGSPIIANAERVQASWSASVWTLQSLKTGTGTVRPMYINADTAYLRLNGSEVSMPVLTSYNLGSPGAAAYERVRGFWSGNQFFLQSEAGGGGTVRPMRIDSGTAGLTLQAGAAGMAITSGGDTSISATGVNYVTAGSSFAFDNVDGANYERVRSFWSGNIWNLKSEKGGAGTLRAMKIDADTQTLTLLSANQVFAGTAAGANVSINYTGGVSNIGLTAVSTIASAAGAAFGGITTGITATLTGSTNITTGTGFNAIDILTPAYSSASGLTITNAATVCIAGAPSAGGGVTITNAYAIWIDSGLARFDGNGTRVFELPADATANATATQGRVPILVGGATKYLRYYND